MSQRQYHSVLFIDSRVAGAGLLLAAAAEGVLVVQLADGGDGVQQIAAALEDRQGLASIQGVLHGASGQSQIGDTVLDAASLATHATALAATTSLRWRTASWPGSATCTRVPATK